MRAQAFHASWSGALLLVIGTGIAALLLTAAMAFGVGVSFSVLFPDTQGILMMELVYLLGLGIVWDVSLIAAASVRRLPIWHLAAGVGGRGVLDAWRARGFFSRGFWPLILLMATSFAIIGSSNLTLINLELLKSDTAWRDPMLWSLEGPLFEWLGRRSPDVQYWDRLYHSAWALELLAAFLLILLARDVRIILGFCLSMLLLFYVGRMLGLLNPVMGPAFFQPHHFGYLAGSISGAAVQLVMAVMQDPEIFNRSAVLLGGVSAMPSLHVGMVALAVYWLAATRRWTLWISVPWLGLVWSATVLLGWHYVLDGIGGIALALACIWGARRLELTVHRAGAWVSARHKHKTC